jgi:hypothetical protein
MESLYFYCAAASSGILLLQLVFGLLGMGHDADFHDGAGDIHFGHADGVDHADHAGTWFVGLLSFRAIVSAVMMFGLAGMSAEKMFEPRTSFLIAVGCGVAVLFGVAYLLKTLYGFANDPFRRASSMWLPSESASVGLGFSDKTTYKSGPLVTEKSSSRKIFELSVSV